MYTIYFLPWFCNYLSKEIIWLFKTVVVVVDDDGFFVLFLFFFFFSDASFLSYQQMLRTQRTLFSLTDGLDFTNDTFSSLNMLLCGQRPDFNSTATFTRARADSRAESENRDRSSQLPAQRNTSKSSRIRSHERTRISWLNLIGHG